MSPEQKSQQQSCSQQRQTGRATGIHARHPAKNNPSQLIAYKMRVQNIWQALMQLKREINMIERIIGSPYFPKTRSAARPQGQKLFPAIHHRQNVQHGGIHQQINSHDGENACQKIAPEHRGRDYEFFPK